MHCIKSHRQYIELFINLKPNCPIVIFLNLIEPRTDILKLPVLSDLRLLLDLINVRRLCISDSSLYLSPHLSLSWYAGTKDLDLQEILSSLFE